VAISSTSVTVPLPPDARIDYKLVIDGQDWILDPLNPHTQLSGFGPNSELAMPAYRSPPELAPHNFPACEIVTVPDFFCPDLNNERTIKVVLPPGYRADRPRPLLVVHDGLEYIDLAGLPHVLAYLAATEPELNLPICVCIPPVQRTAEYAGELQEPFSRFVVDLVLPYINARWNCLVEDPDMCASLGASNGGAISLYLLGIYPQQFRRAVVMSPYVPPAQQELIERQPADMYRIYCNWGTYDLPQLLPLIDAFVARLAARQVPHLSREYHEGHSWGLWRATLAEGLRFIYSDDPTKNWN